MQISRRTALGVAVSPLLAAAAPKRDAAGATVVPKGMWPAMLTPFKQDKSVDWNALDALVDWYLESGADGMFACCASSEVATLSEEERLQVTARVVKRCGTVPVVSAGLPGYEPKTVVPYVKKLMDTGAVAAVLMTNQVAEQAEPDSLWQDRVETLLAATGNVPFGAYELPSPYKRLLTPELMRWAGKTGRFVFLKDTACEINAIAAKCEAAKGTPLRLFNAHVPILVDAIRKNADGFCGIAGNAYPDIVAYATHHALDKNKAEAAQEFLTRNEPVIGKSYPLSAKVMANLAGIPIEPVCRKPVRPITAEQMETLRGLRKAANALLA